MENLDPIIDRILAGEADLFSEIVNVHESMVRATLAAMTPDPNQVPDLAQDVFIIAYQKLATYQKGTHFAAWLRAIARNVAQNERRRWYRRREMEERSRGEIERQVEDRVEALVESLPENLIDTLKDCFNKLQGKTRAVMDGFYFKDNTINELASRLEISASSAKVILHRARYALGSCMQKKGNCDVVE